MTDFGIKPGLAERYNESEVCARNENKDVAKKSARTKVTSEFGQASAII
jgi:hypothetical protein